jgi:Flp pilus assembly pilin Flp
MHSIIARFIREEDGQDLIEYALLATLIALVAGAGAVSLGTSLLDWYNSMGTKVGTWAAQAK